MARRVTPEEVERKRIQRVRHSRILSALNSREAIVAFMGPPLPAPPPKRPRYVTGEWKVRKLYLLHYGEMTKRGLAALDVLIQEHDAACRKLIRKHGIEMEE